MLNGRNGANDWMKTLQCGHCRREFFRHSGRLAMLALGAVTGAVLIRRGQVRADGQTCGNRGICSSCGEYEACGLPQARSRRRVLKEQS